jgi:hypothetical protein
VKSVVAKAFKGDIRALGLVFQLVAKFVVLEEVAVSSEAQDRSPKRGAGGG